MSAFDRLMSATTSSSEDTTLTTGKRRNLNKIIADLSAEELLHVGLCPCYIALQLGNWMAHVVAFVTKIEKGEAWKKFTQWT